MQINQLLKSLLIVLPVVAVSACSSTDDVNSEKEQAMKQEANTVAANNIEDEEKLEEVQQKIDDADAEDLQKVKVIYFDFDTASISSEFGKVLKGHAMVLKDNPELNVTIEGHADERGTPEYNIALGERRANAVAQYIEALGVSSNQVSVVSYGEEKPVAMGHSASDYSKNRRAELVYDSAM